jgi:hypothetical protein
MVALSPPTAFESAFVDDLNSLSAQSRYCSEVNSDFRSAFMVCVDGAMVGLWWGLGGAMGGLWGGYRPPFAGAIAPDFVAGAMVGLWGGYRPPFHSPPTCGGYRPRLCSFAPPLRSFTRKRKIEKAIKARAEEYLEDRVGGVKPKTAKAKKVEYSQVERHRFLVP